MKHLAQVLRRAADRLDPQPRIVPGTNFHLMPAYGHTSVSIAGGTAVAAYNVRP